MVCLFVLSLYANDLAELFFRGKAYISTICLFLAPVAYLATGTPLRALRTRVGMYWLGFGIWLLLALPLSEWRTGSFTLLINYFPRSFMYLFYIAACTISVRQCRQFLQALSLGVFVVLFSCFKFGGYEDDRFIIPHSLVFANPNELALQLALGIAYMTFFFFTGSKILKLVSGVGIVLSLSYMLKTGSRAGLIAIAVIAVVIVLYSRYKVPLIVMGLLVGIVAFLLLPPATRDRLMFVTADTETAQVSSELEAAAVASQDSRQRLLRQSIKLTFTHPLLGVGPDQFPVAAAGEAQKQGTRAAWLGTHNSYTQVSSEAGLPAFFFYTAALWLSLRMNFRRYKRTEARKDLVDIRGMSFSLFLASLVYAIVTFFFHLAYGTYLPILLGLTIALELASRPILEQRTGGSVTVVSR